MRKTSANTLSLALSLLLVISVLFSLPFGVWAETEAVPGDLNGDKLVDANDVTILEAVLNGSQMPVADLGFYDISGNKMVDSEDLIVLKNMVSSENPALADKLNGSTTEDLIPLVTSVNGGSVQSAIAFGDSTKALELNGGTTTVLFAETQNWSTKAALEMDTLWLSGSNQTVNVVLLGADGETILGAPGEVTAQENGWSRISVPLTGILAKVRAKIGGIMITVANDAHLYVDNLALTAAEAEEEEDVLTRAEMENALVEMAWNWFFKGSAYQYDSTSLTSATQHLNDPLCGYAGGKSRLTLFPTLENATSHSIVYSVCSGFAYDLYETALGYPLLGSKFNSLTRTFWRNGSYYPADGSGYDMTVLRWHYLGQGTIFDTDTTDTTVYDTEFLTYDTDENGNVVYNNWYDKEADLTDPDAVSVEDFFANYEENFRPGDIIVYCTPGHTVIYIGNGMVMDVNGAKTVLDEKLSTGGGKYIMEDITDTAGNITTPAGTDKTEPYGCVSYRTFEDVFLNPYNKTMNLDVALAKTPNSVVVLRPLNLLTIDDGDGDPSNDQLNPDYVLNTGLLKYHLSHDKTTEVKTSGYGIDETTATRLQYPAMDIDRTVNITPYGTAVKGDTITYSVKITNNSADTNYAAFRQAGYTGEDYEDLWVVEHIPANTELFAIPDGATLVGDTLRWNITVPKGTADAPGYVELTYTVTVTGEIGDEIVSGGGWVNNIPSNTITNIIGGKKLSDADQTEMAGFDPATITATGTDLAEQIYKNATGQDLELPDVPTLKDIFFSEYTYEVPDGYYLYYNSSSGNSKRYMYKLNAKSPTIEDKLYYDMLVPNYYGGLWCYTDEYNGEPRINELREEYLEVGDILVYMDLTPSTNNGATSQVRVVEGYTVLVYLGSGNFASVDQDGNVTTRSEVIAHPEVFSAYTEAFSHDLFLCLRPSQSYEDLSSTGIPTYTIQWTDAEGNVVETDEGVPYRYVPTYEGAEPTKEGYTFAGWSPAVRPATSDITYKPVFIARDLSAGKLTESELDALAAITPEMVQEAFAYYAMESGNLNYVAPWIYQQAGINYDATDASGAILSTYYTAQKFFTLSGKYWTPIADASVADLYKTMLVDNTYGGTQMNDKPASFEIGYLQIGDLFCAAYDKAQTDNGKTIYYTYLYQGDGKFLLMGEDSAVYTCEEVLNRIYTYKETDYNWSYYYVLRPENYNSAKRDISLRNLTDAERYALSKLTPSEIKYPSYHIASCANKFYTLIGINNLFSSDTSASNYSSSTQNTRDNLFTTTGARVPLAATTDAMRFTQKMAVPCYGGTYMKDTLELADAVKNGTLQIGDIVAGGFKDTHDAGTKNSQFTALYQGIDETGKGKFVILYRDYTTDASTKTDCYVEMYADEIDTWALQYYYTLRPEMLVAETQDTYTVTWVNDDGTVLKEEEVTAYTLPSYGEDPVKTDAQYTYTFAGWTPLTTTVNRDVTYTATYTQGEKKTYTVTWNNDDGTVLETDENVPYGTMPSYDGAEPTKAATEQFTYTFAGWDTEISEVIGDVTYTAVFDANRFLTAHDLTDEEMDALASITPEDVKAALASDDLAGSYLEVVAPWIYKQANIDVSDTDIGSKSVHAVKGYLFTGTVPNVVPRTSTYSKDPATSVLYAAYIPTRVPNAYGGTQMAADTPEFDLDYLQVGDLLCASFFNVGSSGDHREYYVYLYQGDGKFLLVSWDPDIYYWQDIKNKTYTDGDQTYNWSYYYVFRPENYNADRVRDITLRGLTDAEKYALSQLTGEDIGFSTRNLYGTLPEFYKAVGITVDMQGMDHATGRNSQFASADGGRVLCNATDETKRFVQKMMVPCYGGDQLAEEITIEAAVANKLLQIGDVVAGVFSDIETVDSKGNVSNSPFTALYQGNGMFLMVYPEVNPEDATKNITHKVRMSAEEISKNGFAYYYTLRPNNLATVSDDDTFTVTWINEDGTVLETDENVALYAHPSYDSAVVPTKAADAQYTYTFAGWTPVKSAVNSDITYTAVYSKTVNSYTVTWHSGSKVLATDTVPYGEVPVYTGIRPYSSENKGFAGWDKEVVAVTGDVTYTATYTDLRDITDGDLTEAEKAIISSLTLTEWGSNAGSKTLEKMLPWVYKEAGISITNVVGYKSLNAVNVKYIYDGDSTQTATIKDYYNKILVAGSYGLNVTGVGTENLQIGDIVVSVFVWQSEDDFNGQNMYYTAVYLGKDDQNNDRFLVAYDKDPYYNSSNAIKKKTGSVIATFDEIEANYTQDTFETWTFRYVIRPSQLATVPCTVTWKDTNGNVVATEGVPYGTTYATAPTKTVNGYTYTYGDAVETVVTADVAYTATSYVRDLTAHLLTDEEMAALAAITADDVKNANLGSNITNVVSWIYQRANIDVSDTVLASKTIGYVKGYLLAGTSPLLVPRTSTYSGTPATAVLYAAYIPMRVAGAYGGTTLNSACVTELDIASLQVGDLFCAAFAKEQTGATDSSYVVYLYQGMGENGEGQFLLMNKSSAATFSWAEVRDRKYNDTDFGWSYYFVIRPDHYNGRPMESAPLTDAEIYSLSKLTSYDIGFSSRNIYGTLTDYYRAAGITIDKISTDKKDHKGIRNQLFAWNDPSTEDYLVPAEATTDDMRYYQKMKVSVQGGENFAETDRVDISDAIANGTLKTGDVIAGSHLNTYTVNDTEETEEVPFSALYQGEGKFLVYYYVHEDGATSASMTKDTWTTDQVEALNYVYYYTLRPNNLANE